jgi:hypothetical protein
MCDAAPRGSFPQRLLLRDPLPGDAALVFERWARDAEVLRYLGWRAHDDAGTTRRSTGGWATCWRARTTVGA